MVHNVIFVIALALGMTACMDMDGSGRGGQAIVRDGCHVGGCSAQICSDRPDAITTCEWRPEYECYYTATCERQQDGACDWTETEDLQSCLAHAAE